VSHDYNILGITLTNFTGKGITLGTDFLFKAVSTHNSFYFELPTIKSWNPTFKYNYSSMGTKKGNAEIKISNMKIKLEVECTGSSTKGTYLKFYGLYIDISGTTTLISGDFWLTTLSFLFKNFKWVFNIIINYLGAYIANLFFAFRDPLDLAFTFGNLVFDMNVVGKANV